MRKNTKLFNLLGELRIFVSISLILFVNITNIHAVTRYVKQSASGNGSGSSWANASGNLTEMLQASSAGDEVWVAAGNYIPNKNWQGNTPPVYYYWQGRPSREATFFIKDGVKLYGGFAGNETNINQRNINANPTTLNGDIDGLGYPYSFDAYHIVTAAGGNIGVTIDGLRFINGEAKYAFVNSNCNNLWGPCPGQEPSYENINGITFDKNYGAGICINNNGNNVIRNCYFNNNYAGNAGGGVYITGGNSLIENNNFDSNRGDCCGGGVGFGSANVTINKNIFNKNSGYYTAGAVYKSKGNLTVTDNIFTENYSGNGNGGAIAMEVDNMGQDFNVIRANIFYKNDAYSGGAIASWQASSLIENNVMIENSCYSWGGVFTFRKANTTLRNNTFYNNRDQGGGAGVGYMWEQCVTVLTNNIFYLNKGFNNDPSSTELLAEGSNTYSNNNLFQSASYNYYFLNSNSSNYFGYNPSFYNSYNYKGADNIWATADDGLKLNTGSIALNTGNNSSVSQFDISGANRIQNGTVDLGAYEGAICTSFPIKYNITGGGTFCGPQSNIALGLSNSNPGISYQLQLNGNNVGTAVNGTGAAISFGIQTKGTYTAIATTTTGCTATMNGSAIITEAFPPSVNFSVATTCSNSVLTANTTQQKYALSFDGVDDYIDCGNNSMVQLSGNAITLEAWIYPTSWKQYAHEGSVINKEFNDNGSSRGYMLRVGEGGKINFNLGNGSWNELTTSTSVLSLNTWQHIAATYDGTTMKIFVNGNQVASQNRANINFLNSSANLRIGNWSGGEPKRCFPGYIDEVRIWSVARTQTEIQNAQNSTVANNSTGLSAYYKMDENTGISTIDATSNGSNGALVNGPSWINSTSPVATPFTYLWSNSSTASSITVSNDAVYTVTITNDNGCTVSADVNAPPLSFKLDVSVATTCSNSVLTANTTQQKYALSFDGVDDYVDCGNKSMIQLSGNAISLEAWIYPTSWKQYVYEGNVINKEFNENGSSRGYMLRVGEGGKINFNLGNGSWNELTTSTSVLSLNTWQHIAATYDGTTMKIFVNGNQVASQNRANINFLNSSANLRIGNWSGGEPKRCFPGYIDEVRIWSVARTQTEIQNAQYSTVASNSTGLSAYYKMDENKGTLTIDATSNGSNGTLVNGSSRINSTSPVATPFTYLWSNSSTTSSITVSNAATYTVTVTNDNGCALTAPGTAAFTPIATFNVTGGGILCTRDDGGLSIDLSNSENNISYQLQKDGNNIGSPIAGTGGALTFGNFFDAGTYTIVATNAQGCTVTMIGKAIITLSTLSESYTVTGGGTYCAGLDGVEVGLSGSQTGVSYQLKKDNANVGTPIMGTGAAISFGKQTAIGTYNIEATSLVESCIVIFQNNVTIAIDETLPAFVTSSIPANITIDCSDMIPSAINPLVTNNCSTVSMTETSTKGTNTNECSFYNYKITRTWTATDKRGNTATTSQVITVSNKIAPTFGTVNDVTVTEYLIPTTVSFTLNSCGAPTTLSFTETKQDLTPLACQSYHYVLNRIWTVTDICGNISTKTQKITARGIKLTCPSNKTFNTNSDSKNDYNSSTIVSSNMNIAPLFSDNCSFSSLSYSITGATNKNGNGSIAGTTFNIGQSTVQYTLKAFGLTEQCTFTIDIEDNELPRFSSVQHPIFDVCEIPNQLPSNLTPTFTDNCNSPLTLQIVDDVTADVTGCSSKTATLKYTKMLNRTWRVTDDSGNSATTVQKVYIRDMQVPTASAKTAEAFIGNSNITLQAAVFNLNSSDNCTPSNNLVYKICAGTNCTALNNSITLTKAMIPTSQNQAIIPIAFQVWDACNNKSSIVQTSLTLKRTNTLGANQPNHINSIDIDGSNETIVPSEKSNIEAAHGSLRCYPNPFSEDLNLEFNLTQDVQRLVLKVYDNQGRLVETNERGEAESGFYQMRWNLSNLSSGMYHVCLELDGKCTKVERIILVK